MKNKAPSLFQYLDAAFKAGVSHHAIGVSRQPDGGYHFYIHPANVSGATEDFLIWSDPFDEAEDLIGNKLNIPEPDAKRFMEMLRKQRVEESHAPDGVELIADERARQIAKGYDHDHDDMHVVEEIARGAACYAMPAPYRTTGGNGDAPHHWPWSSDDWNPSPDNRIRELVKAGALIAAEIDRLQRNGHA